MDPTTHPAHSADTGRLTGTLDLPWGPARVWLRYPVGPARLSDLVAGAWSLASQISVRCVEALNARGCRVPCRKGCNACCSYLIPLASCEARALRGCIDTLARPQRERILSNLASWSRSTDELPVGYRPAHGAPGRFVQWAHQYADSQSECPLLEGNLCSLYAARPLACREHFVITPPQRCLSGEGASAVPAIASVFEAMTALEAELTGRPVEVVLFPRLHAWWEQYDPAAERLVDGEALARALMLLLGQYASRWRRRAG